MPEVCFRISAVPGGGYWAVKPTEPITHQGSQSAPDMLSQLAGQMGLKFENNGVTAKLVNPYYPGNPWTQAWRIAKHAGAEMWVDRGTMAIAPGGQARGGDTITVSPSTGMIGYPMFREAAIIVRHEWNAAFAPGKQIQVTSDLTPACGTWRIRQMLIELEALVPKGKWQVTLDCDLVGKKPV